MTIDITFTLSDNNANIEMTTAYNFKVTLVKTGLLNSVSEVKEIDLTLPPPEITFEKLTGDNILILTFSE